MEKDKLREMEWLAQGHTAGKWQESQSNLGILPPKPILWIMEHCGYLSGRKSRYFRVRITEFKF